MYFEIYLVFITFIIIMPNGMTIHIFDEDSIPDISQLNDSNGKKFHVMVVDQTDKYIICNPFSVPSKDSLSQDEYKRIRVDMSDKKIQFLIRTENGNTKTVKKDISKAVDFTHIDRMCIVMSNELYPID